MFENCKKTEKLNRVNGYLARKGRFAWKLSQRMREAVELLKQEKFYRMELPDWFMWKAYNLPEQMIRTDTMNTLEKRGIVKIEVCSGGRYSYAAKLINPPYLKVF